MTIAHRRRPFADPGFLSLGAPYAEQSDRRENRFDAVLLSAWGRMSPYFLSGVERNRLERLVERAEDYEKELTVLTDGRLRQTADELRSRLVSAGANLDALALAFALAREAARRHAGMRHFHVQLLGGAAMMGGALAEMQTAQEQSQRLAA